jgi:exodeoxyribonuclease VIII
MNRPLTSASNPEGIFFDMPEEKYRKAPGVNHSTLRHMSQSPAHYKYALENPVEPTQAMIFGTILHGRILEPARVLHVVRPSGMDFRSKTGKEWRDAQTKPILTVEEDNALTQCQQSVFRHETAAEIIRRSKREVSIFKRDKPTGLLLKARLDCLLSDDQDLTTVVDVKSVDDASTADFSRKLFNMSYHEQAALYLDIAEASFFIFIAVEKVPPFAVNVFQLNPASIEVGRRAYRRNLELLKQCIERDDWPAYGDGINEVDVPDFVLARDERERRK